jgi:hypothetical protein
MVISCRKDKCYCGMLENKVNETLLCLFFEDMCFFEERLLEKIVV